MLHILGFLAGLLSVMSPSPHVAADKALTTFLNAGGWSMNTLAFFGINGNAAAFLGLSPPCHSSTRLAKGLGTDVAVHVGHYPP